jgi:hypothetical protein
MNGHANRWSTRWLLWSLALGLAGAALWFGCVLISMGVAALPSSLPRRYAASVAGGDPASHSFSLFWSVAELARWYEGAVLPPVVGALLGVGVGLFRELRLAEAAAATAIFGVAAFSLAGELFPSDMASWVGLALYFFSLVGGACVGRGVRDRRAAAM